MGGRKRLRCFEGTKGEPKPVSVTAQHHAGCSERLNQSVNPCTTTPDSPPQVLNRNEVGAKTMRTIGRRGLQAAASGAARA
ncbi:uncharacterized protein UV8b_02001 [Ustilaginoidea virens]|uniref:Uncharacterized protein n=1 Tax=Ustilaginoidea virens TaxID=1159556 RepID=A0A8E5HM37_USTVR|nr:uncharacterized protein UV8b_02001 [Ustilaginoidea virens]QUC17760.1 hypothetical protein UV8b_02001 [Ustilaginoidea virens]